MAQGDVPTSPGGPLRRRREKRQLEQLAEKAAQREPSPNGARSHVSVIEDQTAVKDREPDGHTPDGPTKPLDDIRPRGFHVRPIPIDQPFEKASPPSSETAADGNDMTS
jgi:hypothetical protein